MQDRQRQSNLLQHGRLGTLNPLQVRFMITTNLAEVNVSEGRVVLPTLTAGVFETLLVNGVAARREECEEAAGRGGAVLLRATDSVIEVDYPALWNGNHDDDQDDECDKYDQWYPLHLDADRLGVGGVDCIASRRGVMESAVRRSHYGKVEGVEGILSGVWEKVACYTLSWEKIDKQLHV